MARYLYVGMLLVFAAVAVALGIAVYQGGVAMLERAQTEVGRVMQVYCLLPLVVVALTGAVGLWYLLRSLKLNLQSREVTIERARTDFTATERGFAPRLIEGVGYGVPTVLVNPNVVPSAVTPLDTAERLEEVSEERRLAGVVGWHLSNAPAQDRAAAASRPTALPIPEPKPSPWEVSHVERLLLEAGEGEER